MMEAFKYWDFLAGLGLFLFAMLQMEAALKVLAGRSITTYLRTHAENRINAAFGGLIATTILQSSSVVALMVLAFVGAGLLSLPAALGVILGSNLGTTFTGWIVATLGFKVELSLLGLPLVGMGALLHVFARGRLSEGGRALLGLGLLLLGLQLMKGSVASLEAMIDINRLAGLSPWQYLAFGVVVAAVIQSSSATIMITLTALHAGIIDLPNAAAVAIGADLGTTTTVMLGALKGSVHKRQVAAGHVLFNCVTDLIAFVFRVPLLALIAMAGVTDPLYALVAFHSLFNLLGLLIFLPLIVPFANFLQRLFKEAEVHEAHYLAEVSPGISSAAVQAVEKESSRVIARVLQVQMAAFSPALENPRGHYPVPYKTAVTQRPDEEFADIYGATKRLEGELLEFTIRLQAQPLEAKESARLGCLLVAVRHAMHAAKAIKDIRHNLQELRDSYEAALQQQRSVVRHAMQDFLNQLFVLRAEDGSTVSFEDLLPLLQDTYRDNEAIHDGIYAAVRSNAVTETQVSTLLNINREILHTRESLVFALGSYYLSEHEAEMLERLPEGGLAGEVQESPA